MNPSISLAPSGQIAVEIPSVLAEGRSHTVEIPFSLGGLSILKKILKARQEVESKKTIGTMASPVASEINRFIESKNREDAAAARRVSKKFDLDNIELEL